LPESAGGVAKAVGFASFPQPFHLHFSGKNKRGKIRLSPEHFSVRPIFPRSSNDLTSAGEVTKEVMFDDGIYGVALIYLLGLLSLQAI
jgi:hypothetical protein